MSGGKDFTVTPNPKAFSPLPSPGLLILCLLDLFFHTKSDFLNTPFQDPCSGPFNFFYSQKKGRRKAKMKVLPAERWWEK